MPIITRISRDFQTGFEVAGLLFQKQADLFYLSRGLDDWEGLPVGESAWRGVRQKLSPSTPVGNEEPPLYVWDRSFLEAKLSAEFSAGKMKGARRFLDYVERYRDLASSEMALSRIPASVTLAQAILESDAGEGFLATEANNHFGIKCQRQPGFKNDGRIEDGDFYPTQLAYDCQLRADDHPWDRFEKYRSVELSYRRHTELLARSNRYNWMLDEYQIGRHYKISKKWFGTEKVPYYAAWAAGLKKSGYATSKRYAQKLAFIIETYELWRLDYGVIEMVM